MKTNVIKLKFINGEMLSVREYTYYTNTEVKAGDKVNVDGEEQGMVTQINVPVEEIERFGDRAKTILGKVEVEE